MTTTVPSRVAGSKLIRYVIWSIWAFRNPTFSKALARASSALPCSVICLPRTPMFAVNPCPSRACMCRRTVRSLICMPRLESCSAICWLPSGCLASRRTLRISNRVLSIRSFMLRPGYSAASGISMDSFSFNG